MTPATGDRVVEPVRVVVSPGVGRFEPAEGALPQAGTHVLPGQVLGELLSSGESQPVVCPFEGVLEGMLALPGERLRDAQPVAWLRVAA